MVTWVWIGIAAASEKSSSPPRRVRFATDPIVCSPPEQLVQDRGDVGHMELNLHISGSGLVGAVGEGHKLVVAEDVRRLFKQDLCHLVL